MRGSKWANFAEFNFADEQFSDKDFAHLTLFSQRKKKSNFADRAIYLNRSITVYIDFNSKMRL